MRTEPHALEPDRHDALHPELDHWRTNVGDPVAVDAGDLAPARLSGIDVLCWNVAIGLGHLDHVIDWLRSEAGVGAVAAAVDAAHESARTRSGALVGAGATAASGAGRRESVGAGASASVEGVSTSRSAARAVGTGVVGAAPWSDERPADRPLVILLQEAYRAGESVPDAPATAHHGGKSAGTGRSDVVELAARHGLSLRYSPSMRNGHHASDRGNAILSTVRLADAQALLLPYVRQRRVVVSAGVAGHPWLRFVSAHLDTHGRSSAVAAGGPFGGGRAAQARELGRMLARSDGSVVLGADLNSVMGMSDVAVRELVAAGMHPAHRVGSWRHTYHTRLRLLLDHVMFRSADDRIARVDVVRLDEAPRDRSRTVFGSDHHPLLAAIELTEPRP